MKSEFKMYLYKLLVILVLIASALALGSCGEGTLDVTEAKYEPKIVVDGYIYPGVNVENIKITRNFPLNTTIDAQKIVLSNADVNLTDLSSGRSYKLTYIPWYYSYAYQGKDLMIATGKSYRLDVKAKIDGKLLSTSSVTTVPLKGFSIKEKTLGPLKYRETDASGELKNFVAEFTPSVSTDFYAVSLLSLDRSFENFIFDNAYFKPDTNQLKEGLDNFRYQYRWLQNINTSASRIQYKVEWFDTWFYGTYRMIIYAADKNFADFILTNNMVQEADGNFHEPKLHLEGDGIGIFGSAIADTVYFTINR